MPGVRIDQTIVQRHTIFCRVLFRRMYWYYTCTNRRLCANSACMRRCMYVWMYVCTYVSMSAVFTSTRRCTGSKSNMSWAHLYMSIPRKLPCIFPHCSGVHPSLSDNVQWQVMEVIWATNIPPSLSLYSRPKFLLDCVWWAALTPTH